MKKLKAALNLQIKPLSFEVLYLLFIVYSVTTLQGVYHGIIPFFVPFINIIPFSILFKRHVLLKFLDVSTYDVGALRLKTSPIKYSHLSVLKAFVLCLILAYSVFSCPMNIKAFYTELLSNTSSVNAYLTMLLPNPFKWFVAYNLGMVTADVLAIPIVDALVIIVATLISVLIYVYENTLHIISASLKYDIEVFLNEVINRYNKES